MALKFIFGLPGSGKTFRCCDEIYKHIKSGNSNAYFIVPDQSTYTTEYTLSQFFPEKGFTNVTVTGFSRLAHKIFKEVHTKKHDALSKLGQDLVLSRILCENQNNLSILSQMSRQPHFVKSLKNIFHRLNSSLINEEMLKKAADAEKGTHLGKKLQDLHILFTAYHKYLKEHFSYIGEIFDLLAQEIPKSNSIKNSEIWIDGYHGFTLQEIKIISSLIKTAKKVTVTLPFESVESAMQNPIFTKPLETWQKLSELQNHSDSVSLINLPRYKSKSIRALVKFGFEPASTICTEKETEEHGIFTISAPDRTLEIDYMARKILHLIRDKKLRYRDIIIILRNPEKYTDLIERTFKKYELPVFIDERDAMTNHPLIVLITGLLAFLTAQSKRKHSGFSRNILFPILKTGLIKDLSIDKVNKLENYIIKNGIRFFQWNREWNFHTVKDIDNPENTISKEEETENKTANEYRLLILDIFENLEKNWSADKTCESRCRTIYNWLISQDIPKTLSVLDEDEFLNSQRRPHLQVWKKVLSLLDEIVNISGDDILPDEHFMSIVKGGVSELSYSMIPSTLDNIIATSIGRGYYMESTAVFIPGMVNGEFPKDIESAEFITDEERKHLAKENLLSAGNDFIYSIYEEQLYTYLALSRAKKYMYVLYPATDFKGESLEPSFIYKKLLNQNYSHKEEKALYPSASRDEKSFFSTPKQAITLLPQILRDNIPDKNSNWEKLKNWVLNRHNEYSNLFYEQRKSFEYNANSTQLSQDLVNKLFKPFGKFYGSISQLEEYRSCPYKYFLNRGLKITDREDGRMQSTDFGNYLHSGLKRFGDLLKSMNKSWKDISDTEIDAFSSQIATSITPLIAHGALTCDASSSYTHRLLNLTFKKSLNQFRKWELNSDFTTTDLEREFKINIKTDENDSFTLRGKIDRIDSYTTGSSRAIAVCDYKTGMQQIDLNGIISGIKLQLVTYMLAMIKENPNENIIPTALMYIYLSHDSQSLSSIPLDETDGKKETDSCDGFYLSDMELLSKLDKFITDENESHKKHINIKLNKNGSIRASTNVLSLSEMENLQKAVENKLIDLYNQISSGNIEIFPTYYNKNSACNYCPYKSVCRFDLALGNKNNFIKKLKNSQVKEMLNESDEKGVAK